MCAFEATPMGPRLPTLAVAEARSYPPYHGLPGIKPDTLHLDHRLVVQQPPSRRAPPTLDHHTPPMASHDSYEGVAGQNLVLLKHFRQPLALVERLRCTERLWERWTAERKSSWK